LALWSEMLAARTAQLPEVLPVRRPAPLGRSPREAIASGLFHGHAGAIRELVQVVARDAFGKAPAVVVGTGGNAPRFAREKLFTELSPDLILIGLRAFAARTTSHA
jgi:type III pantothenate kinase